MRAQSLARISSQGYWNIRRPTVEDKRLHSKPLLQGQCVIGIYKQLQLSILSGSFHEVPTDFRYFQGKPLPAERLHLSAAGTPDE